MNSSPPVRAPFQDQRGTPSDAWVQWLTEVWRGLTGWRQSFHQLVSFNFGSIAAQSQSTTTMAMKGVGVNDAVFVCPTTLTNGIAWDGCVTATNEVTVRCKNYSSGAIDPPATLVNVIVFRQ